MSPSYQNCLLYVRGLTTHSGTLFDSFSELARMFSYQTEMYKSTLKQPEHAHKPWKSSTKKIYTRMLNPDIFTILSYGKFLSKPY